MFKKLISLLSRSERKKVAVLAIIMLLVAFLDTLGVASIMPFIAVLAEPELVNTNYFLSATFDVVKHFGIESVNQFMVVLGLGVFVLLIFSLAVKAMSVFLQTRFAAFGEYAIGKRLVEGYLHQPYSWFLTRHSSQLGRTVLSEVQRVIDYGLVPMMTIMAQGMIAVALLFLLFLVDPILALSVGSVLGVAYGGVFNLMSGWLKRLGKERNKANQGRFKVMAEAFASIKEVKVIGVERAYTRKFGEYAENYAESQSASQVIAQLPRFVFEAMAFGGLLIVALYLMLKRGGGIEDALPVIALYALAGYRLMPALQQIYVAFTRLRVASPIIDDLYVDIQGLPEMAIMSNAPTSLPFSQSIKLNKVSYSYPNSKKLALNNIDIVIRANTTVGIVGSTGSGKTTAIDVVLGLLEPQHGSLEVDGTPITEVNRRRWQSMIGYVPQDISIVDDSVAANIALGVSAEHIDRSALEYAAKMANLHEFVQHSLPYGYDTTVGERGIQLSGGQRQRIGIARALYHKPRLLIMDEATSALDNVTEKIVMDAVGKLNQNITIIIVAHRLSTVRNCDKICFFESGNLIAYGNYDGLLSDNEKFARMVSPEH